MADDYFQEIEAHFALRRGTPFVLSPKDYALMQEWAAQGVPLPVIVEAIDSVFDKAAERNKVVNGLRYCRHAVKELWQERRDMQIGAQEATPEEGAEPLLAALADALAASPHVSIAAFADRVRDLARERSVPRIEERLMELEQELVDALADDALRADAARLTGTVDDKSRARTEQAHVRRLVREKFELPRLTLFA